jgi:hypothetical protein
VVPFSELVLVERVYRRGNELLDDRRGDWTRDGLAPYLCECSHRDCRSTLQLTPDDYLAIRDNESHFVLAPGHDIRGLDRIVRSSANHIVVDKRSP